MTRLLNRPEPAVPERTAVVAQPSRPPVERLVSLDAYRGFTMLAMVSAGLGTAHLLKDSTWGWLADQFEHRRWDGCTFWDLIQPSFMFIVGVAMPFAFALRQERGDSWGRQFLHVCKRCLLLIGIGIFLDTFSQGVVYVQFIRVLQQIAIGYFLAFLVLRFGPLAQIGAAIGLLLVHTLAFVWYANLPKAPEVVSFIPWFRMDNVGVCIDRLLHLPVSTGGYVTINAVSSAATILFGVLAGELLRSDWRPSRKVLTLIGAGCLGLLVGWALMPAVPMIKRLWTASFAIYAAGWTCLLLAGFYGVFDVLGWRRWAFPFVVVGMNSIAIYVAAGLLSPTIRKGLKPFLQPLADGFPRLEPVVQASLVVGVLWLFCFWLYRHRIFFKV